MKTSHGIAIAARAAILASVVSFGLGAQQTAPRQTQADDYTRYELLAPGSAKFRILYEVTATTPGAQYFFNAIRKGSVASDESVRDVATGKALEFGVVNGRIAREQGVRGADSTGEYIRVKLLRPVPTDGEARVLIDKTYYDTTSYQARGDTIVFNRPLGIKRNAVVLPPGFELIGCNFPSQVLLEGDGRIKISFWNNGPGEAPLQLRARRAPPAPVGSLPGPMGDRLAERAHQTAEIWYSLQQPETHSFDLYHDVTTTRPGQAWYANVVRPGSTVSNPRAINLDTGEELVNKTQRSGDTVTVTFYFAAVKDGESRRIRIFETYTDSARYRLWGNELIWDRSFGRPSNIVVLPAGWVLTNSSIPATVSETPDGRIRLDFINSRVDEIAVLITARRRGK